MFFGSTSTSSDECFLFPSSAGTSGRDAGTVCRQENLALVPLCDSQQRLSAATLAEPLNAELFSPHFVFITLLQKHFAVFGQTDCHPGTCTYRWGRLRVICPPLYPRTHLGVHTIF